MVGRFSALDSAEGQGTNVKRFSIAAIALASIFNNIMAGSGHRRCGASSP